MDRFSEMGKAAALQKLYEGSGFKACANPYFECSTGHSVTSSCLLLEGVDFDLTFFPFKYLGRKAVLCATGELFSTMATPKVLKAILGISSKLDFPEVKQIWEGIAGAAKEYGYQDLALDLVPSLTGLSISVSATGFSDKSMAAGRPIAQSMDLICISNNPGAAFLGEMMLRKGKDLGEEERMKKLEKYRQIVGAYLKPELSPFILKAFSDSAIVPSFGYFCKEGLANAIKTLCADSGLGAKLYIDKIPLAGGSVDASKELGVDPVQAALKGGDDCFMLYTIPIGSHEKFRHDFQSWDVIGHMAKPEVGTVLVSPDGLEHNM